MYMQVSEQNLDMYFKLWSITSTSTSNHCFEVKTMSKLCHAYTHFDQNDEYNVSVSFVLQYFEVEVEVEI